MGDTKRLVLQCCRTGWKADVSYPRFAKAQEFRFEGVGYLLFRSASSWPFPLKNADTRSSTVEPVLLAYKADCPRGWCAVIKKRLVVESSLLKGTSISQRLPLTQENPD